MRCKYSPTHPPTQTHRHTHTIPSTKRQYLKKRCILFILKRSKDFIPQFGKSIKHYWKQPWNRTERSICTRLDVHIKYQEGMWTYDWPLGYPDGCIIGSCHRLWYYLFWICICHERRIEQGPIKNTCPILANLKWTLDFLQDFIDRFIEQEYRVCCFWFWCWIQVRRRVRGWKGRRLLLLPSL